MNERNRYGRFFSLAALVAVLLPARTGAQVLADPTRPPDAAQTAALKNLSALALREARTQAFSDAFYLIMMGFLLAALLAPLMKKPPAH